MPVDNFLRPTFGPAQNHFCRAGKMVKSFPQAPPLQGEYHYDTMESYGKYSSRFPREVSKGRAKEIPLGRVCGLPLGWGFLWVGNLPLAFMTKTKAQIKSWGNDGGFHSGKCRCGRIWKTRWIGKCAYYRICPGCRIRTKWCDCSRIEVWQCKK